MASINSRQNSRRQSERRLKERRTINYPFGSTEWLNAIQQKYLLWPKQDRRHHDRRSVDRRLSKRRSNNGSSHSSRTTLIAMQHDLLTHEERQMLNELIQSDKSDENIPH